MKLCKKHDNDNDFYYISIIIKDINSILKINKKVCSQGLISIMINND